MQENITTENTNHAAHGVALAAAGVAAATFMAARPARAISPALTFNDVPGTGNIKVLNYALALEDLETELYVQAFQRLTTGGAGGRDVAASVGQIAGLNQSNGGRDVIYTQKFLAVEQSHRDYLRAKIGQLGGPVIAPFKYDFGIGTMTAKQVVDLIFLAEGTGVMAYLGAIPFFSASDSRTPTILQIAGSIQGTEARHTAIFADILADMYGETVSTAPLPSPGFANSAPFDNGAPNNKGIDRPQTPNAVLAAVSPFIKTS